MKNEYVVSLAFAAMLAASSFPAYAFSSHDAENLAAAAAVGNQKPLGELKHFAQAGNTDAQYWLGVYYTLKQKHELAMGWYKKAAGQGNVKAAYSLGQAYFNGAGDLSTTHVRPNGTGRPQNMAMPMRNIIWRSNMN